MRASQAAIAALLLAASWLPGGVATATASDEQQITSVPYTTTFDMSGDTGGGGDICFGPNTEATAGGSTSFLLHVDRPESIRFAAGSTESSTSADLVDSAGHALSCGSDVAVQPGKDYRLYVTWYADGGGSAPSSVTLAVTHSPQVGVGVVRGRRWYLAPKPGARANQALTYGEPSDTALVLDNRPTIRRGAVWYPRKAYSFSYGSATDKPVTGDWNGRTDAGYYGADTYYTGLPGVVAKGTWSLSTYSDQSTPHTTKRFRLGGGPQDVYLSGDWNGDTLSTPAIFRAGQWYFSNTLGGPATSRCAFGKAGDIPVVGDWNGDGTDTPGVFRSGHWYTIDHSGGPVRSFVLGGPGDRPVVGHWG